MGAFDRLEARVRRAGSLLCVGLDPELERLPERFRGRPSPLLAHNRFLVTQTHPYAVAYKANLAFYEARGAAGWRELERTLGHLRSRYPEVYTVGDAKRADVGSTSAAYAAALYDRLGFDAVTLSPYLGRDALEPFLEREDRGAFVLCRTSNPGAAEFQDLDVGGRPLWERVLEAVLERWNGRGNCGLVVGATRPAELARARTLAPGLPILAPGVGAQGAAVMDTVRAGVNGTGSGLLVTASRSISGADDPGLAARRLRDEINLYR